MVDDGSLNQEDAPRDPPEGRTGLWRCSTAIFHLEHALEELRSFMSDLVPLHAETEARVRDYFERKRPDGPVEGDDYADFDVETLPLHELELMIKLRGEIACLMSAILAEDELNRFCVYNLPGEMAESIERLALPEKLLVASAAAGDAQAKAHAVYGSARMLTSWRNAFAHGHCVDMPTKSLRHNHLAEPAEFPGVPSVLKDTQQLVNCYLRIHDYLRKLSVDPLTAQTSGNVQRIRTSLRALGTYRVTGSNWTYAITLAPSAIRVVRDALGRVVEKDRAQAIRLVADVAVVDPLERDLIELEVGLADGRERTLDEIAEYFEAPRAFVAKHRASALTYLASHLDLLP